MVALRTANRIQLHHWSFWFSHEPIREWYWGINEKTNLRLMSILEMSYGLSPFGHEFAAELEQV